MFPETRSRGCLAMQHIYSSLTGACLASSGTYTTSSLRSGRATSVCGFRRPRSVVGSATLLRFLLVTFEEFGTL